MIYINIFKILIMHFTENDFFNVNFYFDQSN